MIANALARDRFPLYCAGVTITRRATLTALAAATARAQSRQRYPNWKPKLGILCSYSDSNLEFARQEGFTSVQLAGGQALDPLKQDDSVRAAVKEKIQRAGIPASS